MKSLHAIVEELDAPPSLLRSLTIKCHLLKGDASLFKCHILKGDILLCKRHSFFFYKTKKKIIQKKNLYIPKNINKTKNIK
jgi:hypothetical protein